MTDLTEQWKKGELETGYYFFKTKDNIKIGFLYEGFKHPYDGRYNTIDNVEEVLEPVPSYQEYQQLKELLREWVQFETEENPNDFTVIFERMDDLLTRINAAIGESEE